MSRIDCPGGCLNFISQRAHKITRNLLNKLLFTCQYEKYGCKELVCHDNVELHESECLFKIVRCPAYNDCGFQTTKEMLEIHKKNCGFIKERCTDCY